MRAGQKQLGVSCYFPAKFHQSGLLQKSDSKAASGGICSLSWLAAAALGLAVHAAPVNTSFVSVSKGDLGLVEEECCISKEKICFASKFSYWQHCTVSVLCMWNQ